MGGSAALQLAHEIPHSIDQIILLSPAGLLEIQNIPFLLIKLELRSLIAARKKVFVGSFWYPDRSR